MKPPEKSPSLYWKNRKKIITSLPSKSIMILCSHDTMHRNGDQSFPYRQESDFLYLTGITQEKSILVINPTAAEENDQSLLFIIKPDATMKTWTGRGLSISDAKKISGIQRTHYLCDFDDILHSIAKNCHSIFLKSWKNEQQNQNNNSNKINLLHKIQGLFPMLTLHHADQLIKTCRTIKEPEEIRFMQKACNITSIAFHRVLSTISPMTTEYDIEAEITYAFLKQACRNHAYPPIIASGKNATILHYTSNNKKCHPEDMVLLDFGAEYNGYASDCSRTIPVNGVFSTRQKKCYEAVLRVQKAAIKMFTPGNTINKINHEVKNLMEKELIKLGLCSKRDIEKKPLHYHVNRYTIHCCSHFIGLDVHDVGERNLPFVEGMTLTIEPGLYIPEERIGIRIEDNIVVGNPPKNLMKKIPKEIKQLEVMMKTQRLKIKQRDL